MVDASTMRLQPQRARSLDSNSSWDETATSTAVGGEGLTIEDEDYGVAGVPEAARSESTRRSKSATFI